MAARVERSWPLHQRPPGQHRGCQQRDKYWNVGGFGRPAQRAVRIAESSRRRFVSNLGYLRGRAGVG